ncbi:ATP-NAD kinase-like domain-containing protein [Coprinopsis sp. MPI-PUGE-AT-0042]|nr:ATP-NAD kinase-like domain-containing protein [Coprinopsis sp. MPI-PUGE-AT-0042]
MSSNLNESGIHVSLSSSHHTLTYRWTETELVLFHDLRKDRGSQSVKSHRVPHERVLRVSYDNTDAKLYVAYLKTPKLGKTPSLVVLNGIVQNNEKDEVEAWAQAAMDSVYKARGIKPFRRVLVFVNPNGGSGKALKIFEKSVRPILQAAMCEFKVIQTERQGHAFDVTKALDLVYDVIVTVSGDGLVHEVMNGLGHHEQPIKALSIPVAPIPAGSGNGLSLNLLGLERGFCAATAALNIVKGSPMKIDLFSFTQNGKRNLSFMSQSLGLMADLDLDTEHLRWMGDTRFVYGFIRGVLSLDACPIQLSIKVAEKDKHKMAQAAHERNQGSSPLVDDGKDAHSLPSLKYLPDDETDDWVTIDEPMLFAYAGQGPYVSRDYMAFPVSVPDDGLIDISVMPITTRKDALSNISTAPSGESYWGPRLQYYKAHAYRVKPLVPKGNLSIDGERYPFEEFQVEVHQGLGTLLSSVGRFAVDFKPQPSTAGAL